MSNASSSPDPLSMATTSPIRSSQRRSAKGPHTARSSKYHTSPANKSQSMIIEPKDAQGTPWRFKVTVQAEATPTLIPLNDNPSPAKRKGTPRETAKKSTPARGPAAVESDIPELCPVSALGDHESADYSLSEIDIPEPSSFAHGEVPLADYSSTQPLPECVPTFHDDEEAEAVLGAAEPGDATVLESEEFSMISVDSLHSHRNGQSSPAPPATSAEPQTFAEQSYMPSSPPAFAMDRVTPVPSDEPQHHPQAPPPIHLHDVNVPTPRRESAKMSGKALQDALNGPFRESVSRESPTVREGIFNGFGSGTRRQLRQSLYTGQNLDSQSHLSPAVHNAPQLAPTRSTYLSPFHSPVRQSHLSQSRQNRLPTPEPDSQSVSRPASVPTSDAHGEVEYPRLSDAVRQSQLPSPTHAYDDMSWVAASQLHIQPTQTQSPPKSSYTQDASDKQNTQADDEDRDIWQEEASRSVIDDDDEPAQTDLFLDSLPVKPRRSKLPGTWRRTSGANFSYSDSPEPDAQPIRKVSASTAQSSRKTSGVMTPPSSGESGDEHVTRDETKSAKAGDADAEDSDNNTERVNTPSEGRSQVSAQDSPASGDDTGLFWQSNLPSIYVKNRRAAQSVTPSSPLRNTILDISPAKPARDSAQLGTNSAAPVPSPLHLSSVKTSSGDAAPYTASNAVRSGADASETQTDSSMASDVRQLHREMNQQPTSAPSTIDLTNDTPSESEGSMYSSRADFSKSYEEELNLESPTRVKVNFNDSSNSSLLDSRNQYPPLFDNVPALPKPNTSSPASPPRSPSVIARLTESFWEAVTKPPVYAPEKVQSPAVVHETEATTSTVPDHVLRLRRKYGLLSEMHPLNYAHIRTLHRMLNSSRARSGKSIIPRSGPLGHNLSRLLGKTKTNELDQHFIWTSSHLHVVDAFMSLLLPATECARLQAETGIWGDAEAIKHRGKDSKGRKAEDTVFEGVKGGRIEAEWVADVLADIVFKEEMNAKKKKVAEMIARAEQWERMER